MNDNITITCVVIILLIGALLILVLINASSIKNSNVSNDPPFTPPIKSGPKILPCLYDYDQNNTNLNQQCNITNPFCINGNCQNSLVGISCLSSDHCNTMRRNIAKNDYNLHSSLDQPMYCVNNTCVITQSQLGDPCDEFSCVPGLECDPQQKVCIVPPQEIIETPIQLSNKKLLIKSPEYMKQVNRFNPYSTKGYNPSVNPLMNNGYNPQLNPLLNNKNKPSNNISNVINPLIRNGQNPLMNPSLNNNRNKISFK